MALTEYSLPPAYLESVYNTLEERYTIGDKFGMIPVALAAWYFPKRNLMPTHAMVHPNRDSVVSNSLPLGLLSRESSGKCVV